MTTPTEVCPHGSLRRKCEVCERDDLIELLDGYLRLIDKETRKFGKEMAEALDRISDFCYAARKREPLDDYDREELKEEVWTQEEINEAIKKAEELKAFFWKDDDNEKPIR